jgi:Ca2+/H+ antiporter
MMDAGLMNGSIYGSIVNVSGVLGCAVLGPGVKIRSR